MQYLIAPASKEVTLYRLFERAWKGSSRHSVLQYLIGKPFELGFKRLVISDKI